jgi:hypothetical protein
MAFESAVKRWLDNNQKEILAAIAKGLDTRKSLIDAAQPLAARNNAAADDRPYLTTAQLAARWGFHVESVRRIHRRDDWPVARIGRRICIPLALVKKIEAEATTGHGRA